MATRCQRSILSCSRCRKRKMKCDRQLPSCSQCVSAKVTCTGISAKKATDVPRSIVQHLESEIARLETELVHDGRLDMDIVHASDILVQMPSMAFLPLDAAGMDVGELSTSNSQTSKSNGDEGRINGRALIESQEQIQNRALRTSILSGKPLQAIVSSMLPYGSGAADLLSRVRMGMTPSAAQVGDSGRAAAAASNTNSKASKASNNILLNATVLRSIPADIALRLVRKYLNTIQHDSPFLVASTVMQQFYNVAQTLGWAPEQLNERHQDGTEEPRGRNRRVTHTETQNEQMQQRLHNREQQRPITNTADGGDMLEPMPVMPSHDFLVIYLVLAISVTLGSANNGHEERCMTLSMSLFEEGIQHFSSLPSFPSDIAWLQTILLILLYATVFPRSANVWVLSGAAMRAYLELGLHREPAEESNHDLAPEMLDLRRRVFWTAYCMDRSICSALQRPLSTPDAAINTKLPAPLGDNDTLLCSITYHRLLSEMLHVHFQREPIPDGLTWEAWLADVENRLRAWYKLYGSSSESSAHHNHHQEMISFDMARGLMILHRPSPCVPEPPGSSLLIAFEAASTAARIHQDHIRTGFFRRPWLSAHHTIEAATVVLFCLRHGASAIMERFDAAHVFEMTKLFTSNLLSIAAQGWPEVSVYASVYERLLGPLLERLFLRRQDLSDAFGPAQDAELMRLLYPGPAHLEKLRFGWRQQQEELSPFDFNLFMVDDPIWGDGDLDFTGDGGDHGDAPRWDLMGLQGAEF